MQILGKRPPRLRGSEAKPGRGSLQNAYAHRTLYDAEQQTCMTDMHMPLLDYEDNSVLRYGTGFGCGTAKAEHAFLSRSLRLDNLSNPVYLLIDRYTFDTLEMQLRRVRCYSAAGLTRHRSWPSASVSKAISTRGEDTADRAAHSLDAASGHSLADARPR